MYADTGYSRHTYPPNSLYRELAKSLFIGQLSSDCDRWIYYSAVVLRSPLRIYSTAGILLWSTILDRNGVLLLRSNGEDVVRQTVRAGISLVLGRAAS